MRYHAALAQQSCRRPARAWLIAGPGAVMLAAGLALAAPAASASALPTPARLPAAAPAVTAVHTSRHACAAPAPGHMTCMAMVETSTPVVAQARLGPDAAPTGDGYGPPQLQGAYQLPSATAGAGVTVALIEGYDDPNLQSDLATYRADWGLPACGNGCFEKVNQNGQTSPLPPTNKPSEWATEESLDVDMVSAICPLCHILVVEATDDSDDNLGAAENTAVSMGARYLSNSFGSDEASGDLSEDSQFYNHPGVVITASAGDDGYSVSYPASSPDVVGVGGTTLNTSSSSRGWTETVWNGSGSGCSTMEPKPSWQQDTGCGHRTDNDVAADADPDTGAAVYDTYDEHGWFQVGGTSESAPIIAAVYALAGTPAAGSYPASYLYAHSSELNDVTSGSDGGCNPSYLCTAQPGYDGPTGWGTPDGVAAFTSSGSGGGGTGGGTPPPGGVTITGNHSGLCLNVTGDSSTLKSTADIDTCTSGSTQMWTVNSSGTIVNGNGLCLSVSGGSTALKATADVYTCNSSASEFWTVNSSGTITNSNSKLCLSVTGASTTPGATADMYTCNGSVSENWTAG